MNPITMLVWYVAILKRKFKGWQLDKNLGKALEPGFKAQWVAALRSGKYFQARGQLKSKNGGFCCLGVAEDIMMPKTKNKWAPDNPGWNLQSGKDIPNRSVMSPKLGDMVGLYAGCGFIPYDIRDEVSEFLMSEAKRLKLHSYITAVEEGTYPESLANMNDMGVPFPVIADVIEKYL